MVKVSLSDGVKQSVVYAGLDDHKAFVQVCVMDALGRVLSNHRCANSVQVIRARVESRGVAV